MKLNVPMTVKFSALPAASQDSGVIEGVAVGYNKIISKTVATPKGPQKIKFMLLPGCFKRSIDHNPSIPLDELHGDDQRFSRPIGNVILNDRGNELNFQAQFALENSDAAGAWALVKRGVYNSVSVTFDLIRFAEKSGVIEVSEARLISLTVCPQRWAADPDAAITEYFTNKAPADRPQSAEGEISPAEIRRGGPAEIIMDDPASSHSSETQTSKPKSEETMNDEELKKLQAEHVKLMADVAGLTAALAESRAVNEKQAATIAESEKLRVKFMADADAAAKSAAELKAASDKAAADQAEELKKLTARIALMEKKTNRLPEITESGEEPTEAELEMARKMGTEATLKKFKTKK